MNTEQQIEAVLFWKGESVTTAWLSKALGISAEETEAGLSALEQSLSGRGIRLARIADEIALTTAAKSSPLIEKLTKDELVRDLGKAGLETLSIILYRGPVTRRDIDYIRGVNSQFILRNLIVRGLVGKAPNPEDERSFIYKPTLELLAHLGIEKTGLLPEYAKVREEISSWEKSSGEESPAESGNKPEEQPELTDGEQ